MHPITHQTNANPATNPPATTQTTPTLFTSAAPVLCCAGADATVDEAAWLTVLDDKDDDLTALEDTPVAADE